MTTPPRAPVPRLAAQGGPAVLAYGFRPFFLATAVWAVLAMVVWIAVLSGGVAAPSAFDPLAWHIHEMLFGFGVAAVAGFLLTAVPNWTGRLPVQGRPLLTLATLWLAGRLAVATSALIGPIPAAVIDLSFLAALLVVVVREIAVGKNWRNLPMGVALAALLAANLLTHADVVGLAATFDLGWRLGVATITLLIVLIGGRIVPSFTRNWLAKQGAAALPASGDGLDTATLAISAVALVAWVAAPNEPLTAAVLAAAAVLNLVRLARWRGWATLRQPLVLILHVGYAWVPVGFVLLALGVDGGVLAGRAVVHGLTAGAFGTMILAVMTRATRGHTGRDLHAGPATVAIYALVVASALARVASALWPDAYQPLLWASAISWIAAFALFLVVYGPMLVTARPDGRPG